MIEKHIQHDLDLHVLFVDYKQAFDSINREELIIAMNALGIPKKLIRLVAMTMRDPKAKVKIGQQLTNSFQVTSGVKEGDGLSTTLFIIALHYVINKIDQRCNIFTKSS